MSKRQSLMISVQSHLIANRICKNNLAQIMVNRSLVKSCTYFLLELFSLTRDEYQNLELIPLGHHISLICRIFIFSAWPLTTRSYRSCTATWTNASAPWSMPFGEYGEPPLTNTVNMKPLLTNTVNMKPLLTKTVNMKS